MEATYVTCFPNFDYYY